MMHTA